METSDSGATHTVLNAQNDRGGLGPKDTINSGHNVAVLNAKIKWVRCGTNRDLYFRS